MFSFKATLKAILVFWPVNIAFLLLGIFCIPAYAQTDDMSAVSTSLYVPENMLVGHKYYGMVTHSDHADASLQIHIKSNPDAIKTDSVITILPYENHGIFEIMPLYAGKFVISVLVDDTTIHETVSISDLPSHESLLLIMPQKTSAENILGAVYVVDSLNNPVIAQHDIALTLRSSSGIVVPNDIIISQNSTGATFQIHVASSGSISASGGMMHDKAEITSTTHRPILVMDVYPKIMQENSFGYYFLWFENDGKPYIPSAVTSASVHSSDKNVARMTLGMNNDYVTTTFSDGVGYGRIFTGNAGVASVTSTVSGFGSATADFVVGPASFGTTTYNGTALENAPKPIASYDKTLAANRLDFEIIPPVTVSQSYVAAALYHATHTSTVTIGQDNIKIHEETIDTYPVLADGRNIFITSNGATHDSVRTLDTFDIRTHANLYELGGIPGTYDISVTTPQVAPHKSESFTILSDSSETYHLNITPLPVIPGHIQDLALLYVADSADSVIDPGMVFGGGIAIHLKSDTTHLDDFVALNYPVSVIRGYSDGTITAFANEADTVTREIGTSRVSDGTIIIDAPAKIYSHESFVSSAHLFRDDILVANVSNIIETTGGCTRYADTFSCVGPGSLVVFSELGHDEVQMIPYMRPIDATLEYAFDVSSPLSLGKNYTIVSTAPKDSHIFVDSIIDHTIQDNTIVLMPALTGKFDLTITVSRPGMTGYIERLEILVNDLVDIEIRATDLHDIQIGVDSSILSSLVSHVEMTDYTASVPRGSVTVEYPQSARHGNYGYKLSSIMLNGMIHAGTNAVTFMLDHDSVVHATYEQVILINVIDGRGGGIYRPGDTVTILANERYVLAFLVREVLDSWEGIDSSESTVRFVATDDITIVGIYRTDYTGAAAVFAIMGVFITVMVFRENNLYYLKISQTLDFILSGMTPLRRFMAKKPKR